MPLRRPPAASLGGAELGLARQHRIQTQQNDGAGQELIRGSDRNSAIIQTAATRVSDRTRMTFTLH